MDFKPFVQKEYLCTSYSCPLNFQESVIMCGEPVNLVEEISRQPKVNTAVSVLFAAFNKIYTEKQDQKPHKIQSELLKDKPQQSWKNESSQFSRNERPIKLVPSNIKLLKRYY